MPGAFRHSPASGISNSSSGTDVSNRERRLKRSNGSIWFDDDLVGAALKELDEGEAQVSTHQRRVAHILEAGEPILGLVIMINVVIVIMETDHLAHTDEHGIPIWLAVTSKSLSAFYLCELLMRFFVHRRNFFRDSMRIMDFVVVLLDVLAEVASFF